uniref:Uncharacterized protein n=1 Tax=Romanomermis culicivorax TaxID=13658 RepID=A0A915IA78_ROMCU
MADGRPRLKPKVRNIKRSMCHTNCGNRRSSASISGIHATEYACRSFNGSLSSVTEADVAIENVRFSKKLCSLTTDRLFVLRVYAMSISRTTLRPVLFLFVKLIINRLSRWLRRHRRCAMMMNFGFGRRNIAGREFRLRAECLKTRFFDISFSGGLIDNAVAVLVVLSITELDRNGRRASTLAATG